MSGAGWVIITKIKALSLSRGTGTHAECSACLEDAWNSLTSVMDMLALFHFQVFADNTNGLPAILCEIEHIPTISTPPNCAESIY